MGQFEERDKIEEIMSFGGKNNNEYTLLHYKGKHIEWWNVAHWYDPETRSWAAGNYAYSLEQALATCLEKMNSEFLKSENQIETENKFGITYDRMSEIATKAIDDLFYADEDNAMSTLENEIQMEEMELMYFERIRKLDDYDENWQYGDSDDERTVIVDGEELECEMTMNPAVLDRYCNRVEIDGKYYYFS